MENFICKTCGIQYAARERPPDQCIICEDERQYIGLEGQQWTTIKELWAQGYQNKINLLEPNLYSISTRPGFAIGQRALLVITPDGNILWDSISYVDKETVTNIERLGGIYALAVSHPHFYSSIVEWSHAFNRAPIYLPEADRDWITRPDPAITFWNESKELLPGVTLIQCGGHFEGSAVLHWAMGAGNRGALLVGDTMSVTLDRKYVSFMRSYPNLIPLSAQEITRIVEKVTPFDFDRVYGAWWNREIIENGKDVIFRSAERYLNHIRDKAEHGV